MPRRERRAPARTAARQPPLRLHADPQVPDAGAALRPARRDRLTDEAHRSQYDTLALNMRAALPNALFLAFTGTPLIAGEERTTEVFGDYVSIYDFQQSVEDGATVPLFYENRTPELQLVNPDLNDDIYDADRSGRPRRGAGSEARTGARPAVPPDHPRRPAGDGRQGHRAAFPRARVSGQGDGRVHRQGHRAADVRQGAEALGRRNACRVEAELDALTTLGQPTRAPRELQQRLDVLTTTDMAVIVSPGQNEIEQMKALGLDIVPHRKRMNESKPLDEKFKDPNDPLRLVFVCAMWLTGFDAPSCSTIYLDKPMRNHTLMQTIARANRVFPGKHSGLIVDYANVFASLEKALAIYGKPGSDGKTPVRDKDALVDELRKRSRALEAFCTGAGVRPSGDRGCARRARSADARRRGGQCAPRARRAAQRRSSPSPARRPALHGDQAAPSGRRIRGAHGDGHGARPRRSAPRRRPEQADIADVLTQHRRGARPLHRGHRRWSGTAPPPIDLSRIDFKALAARFKALDDEEPRSERLKAAIRAQLDRIIAANETRVDFREKFEALIDAYNAGSLQIRAALPELLELSRHAHRRRGTPRPRAAPEEELVVFDLLTRPGPDLSTEERDEVKKVARQLLAQLKAILTLDWQKTAQARARVRDAIEETLDDGLPPGLHARRVQGQGRGGFSARLRALQPSRMTVWFRAAAVRGRRRRREAYRAHHRPTTPAPAACPQPRTARARRRATPPRRAFAPRGTPPARARRCIPSAPPPGGAQA